MKLVFSVAAGSILLNEEDEPIAGSWETLDLSKEKMSGKQTRVFLPLSCAGNSDCQICERGA